MKKIILLPNTDTVTLCLPEQWVGVPVMCKLTPLLNQNINLDEIDIEAEKKFLFLNRKRRKKNK